LSSRSLGGSMPGCSSRTGRRRPAKACWSGWRAVSPCLDGSDLALSDGQCQAGDGQAVHQHGAGTALAQFAAVLGAGQVEVLAEDLEQALVDGDDHVPRFAIDGERELRLQMRPPSERAPVSLRPITDTRKSA
jgi:hypothetical protein